MEKSLDTITDEVPLADRKNMVYSGGFVTYGRGAYVVTEVGMQTEVGKIASLIQNAEARKPRCKSHWTSSASGFLSVS